MILSKRKITAFIVTLMGIGIIVLFFYVRGRAQADFVAELSDRLVQAGVPNAVVSVKSQDPLNIEITLTISGYGDERTSEDFWYKHLAWREAVLSYKYGQRIDSFTLVFVDSQQNYIDSVQIFLYPHLPSQNPYPYGASKLDDQKTEEFVSERINLYGFSLESQKVTTGIGASDDVQLLELQLETSDIHSANSALEVFIPSLRPLLTGINKDGVGRIVVCWVKLKDTDGDLLLEYLLDLEISRETWYKDKRIKNWYGEPLEAGPKLETTSLPTSTANIPEPYPLPESTVAPLKRTTPYP